MNNNLPEHPFWSFSLRIYSDEEAKSAFLHCQSAFEANVNILLFILWLADTGQGYLQAQDFQTLDSHVLMWHQKLTQSLRQLRKQISHSMALKDNTALKQQALATELYSEQIEQLMIKDAIFRTPQPERGLWQCVSDAIMGFKNYSTHLRYRLQDSDVMACKVLLSVVFPKVSDVDLDILCESLSSHSNEKES